MIWKILNHNAQSGNDITYPQGITILSSTFVNKNWAEFAYNSTLEYSYF